MAKNYTDVLIEEYNSELNEAGRYSNYRRANLTDYSEVYRKSFWNVAKSNIINVNAFHRGYDEELKRLGLMDQFDADGMVKSKSSYSVFKNAANAHPDSWAIKAALKFCSMRFWNNAKTDEEVQAEEAAAREAGRQKRTEAVSKAKAYIDEHNEDLVNIVKTVAMGMDNVDSVLTKQAQMVNLGIKIADVGEEAYGRRPLGTQDPKSEKVTGHEVSGCRVGYSRNDYEVNTYVSYRAICSDQGVKVPELKDIYLFSVDLDTITDYIDSNGTSTAFADSVRASLSNELDKLEREYDRQIEFRKQRLADEQANLAQINTVRAKNKDIIAAVAKGAQPDKSIVDEIIKTAHDINEHRSREYNSWASWSGDDGDSGAAYASETSQGIDVLDRYLHNTHWDSNVGSFHGGSDQEYQRAVADLISDELSNITFVK